LSDGGAAESGGILEVLEVVVVVKRGNEDRDAVLRSLDCGLVGIEGEISVACDIADNGNGWHGVIVAHKKVAAVLKYKIWI